MKKQILIGIDSFEEIIEGNYFYIDKTLFIKELLENRGKVTLITRPRRFGKTMNMCMMQSFFDVKRDSKKKFEGLKIMEHTDLVEKHLNKYPVIFLTLKDIEEKTYDQVMNNIKGVIADLFQKNLYLMDSEKFNEFQKKKFYTFNEEKATESDLKKSLKFLSECLYTYHQKKVIVLFDEYDVPIDSSYRKGFYTEMIEFMRGFMGNVFKSNEYLEFGVLTGVLRIAKEGLVSSFNNPMVRSVLNKDFATCFGFTEDEVRIACDMYNVGDKFADVKTWYDGYRFGEQEMYNPWSIAQYLKSKEIDIYWVNTGSTDTLQDMFYKGDPNLRNDLAGLLTGKPILMSLEDTFTYPIEYVNSDRFWSLFLHAGYLKPCKNRHLYTEAERRQRELPDNAFFYAELVNYEIIYILSKYAKEWFQRKQSKISQTIVEFVSYLLNGEVEKVSDILNNELLNNPSCHDFKEENSYHMFIYGILLAVSTDYTVYSNQESGKGRSDCLIKPHDKNKYAAVIEFKHVRETALRGGGGGGSSAVSIAPIDDTHPEKDVITINSKLKEIALQGLDQINEKAYIHNLKKEGYEKIMKYSIAFYKKTCEVAFLIQN